MRVALGAVATGLLLAVSTNNALADASYADVAGDSGSAPDFTMVDVSKTRSFSFRVGSITLEPVGADRAPDLPQSWSYDLAIPTLTLHAPKPVGTPARPLAGRRFKVSVEVVSSILGPSAPFISASCSARVGGTRLKTIARFGPYPAGGAGVAQCFMNVPRTARGKTLRGSVTARAEGASVTR